MKFLESRKVIFVAAALLCCLVTPPLAAAIPCSNASPYAYNNTIAPCYPDGVVTLGNLPQLWDNNTQGTFDGARPVDSAKAGVFAQWVYDSLNTAPYALLVNVPSSYKSWMFFRPHAPTGNSAPMSVVALILPTAPKDNQGMPTQVGTLKTFGQSLAAVDSTHPFTPSFPSCPTEDMTSDPAKREAQMTCLARLSVFMKYAKYFAGACGAAHPPAGCFANNRTPNNWQTLYLTTYKSVVKSIQTLAWMLNGADVASCQNDAIDFKCNAGFAWNSPLLLGRTTVQARKVTSQQLIGLPWIPADAQEVDPATQTPKWLFTQTQDSPLEDGTIKVSKAHYPNVEPKVEEFTFTKFLVAPGSVDQLLSKVTNFEAGTAGTMTYSPTTSYQCALSSGHGGDFAIPGNRCNPLEYNSESYDGQYVRKVYSLNNATGTHFASADPDQPYGRYEYKTDCVWSPPAGGGAAGMIRTCTPYLSTFERNVYTAPNRTSWRPACRAVFYAPSVQALIGGTASRRKLLSISMLIPNTSYGLGMATEIFEDHPMVRACLTGTGFVNATF